MSKNVVAIGGGTGLSTILRGLKYFTDDVTAIVTTADDGGGSGILRRDQNMLPPGDIRNCIVALSNAEPSMKKLLQYRFDTGSLKGQNFGNLLLAALNNIYGSFEEGIEELGNVLSITGKVYPVTTENVHLVAEFDNMEKCIGESAIPKVALSMNTKINRISMFPNIPMAFEKAIGAINRADIILLGPGSLYTSIIPNLIPMGMVDAISKSRADVVYISNIMTENGETDGYGLKDHLKAIFRHSRDDLIDYVLINSKVPKSKILSDYLEKSNQSLIEVKTEDIVFLKEKNIELVESDFLEMDSDLIRHSSYKICSCIFKMFE